MTEKPRYASLRDYLQVIRAQWLIIVSITAVAGGVAYFVAQRQESRYEATATIAFQDVSQQLSLLGASVSPNVPPEQQPAARAQTINEPAVARRVKRALKSPLAAATIQGAIVTSVDPRSFLVHVTAAWGDPSFAARLANEFARQAAIFTNKETRAQYAATLPELRGRLDRLGTSLPDQAERAALIGTLTRVEFLSINSRLARTVQMARKPGIPVSPKPMRQAALGLLLGLALGLFVAFVRDSLDQRLRSVRDIQSQLGFPLLGHVPSEAMGKVARIGNGRNGQIDEDLEAFRILRQNLEFLSVDPPMRSVLVTSPLPEEGKTTVAASLACSLVIAGKQTLLLGCDLRRPALAAMLNLPQAPGLTDYLAGRADLQEILQVLPLASPPVTNGAGGRSPKSGEELGSLVCIMAGTPSPRPTELLGSEGFRTLLEAVTGIYDIVVLDSSPLLSVADTLELLPQVDGRLICIRSSHTTRGQALAAKSALEHYPARPTGLVVTGLRPRDAAEYGYYSQEPKQTAAGSKA